MSNWVLPPPRTGRAPLTHPAPHGGYHAATNHSDLHAGSVIIVHPALCPDDASPSMPPPLGCLPSTSVTRLQRYYAAFRLPRAVCAPHLFGLYTHTRVDVVGNHAKQELWDLTGCLEDILCSAKGPWTPGLRQPLAMTRLPILPSSMHKPWAGSDSYKISGLNTIHGWKTNPVHSSSLPFCVRFNVPVTRHAATLDTEPGASGYSDGVHTR